MRFRWIILYLSHFCYQKFSFFNIFIFIKIFHFLTFSFLQNLHFFIFFSTFSFLSKIFIFLQNLHFFFKIFIFLFGSFHLFQKFLIFYQICIIVFQFIIYFFLTFIFSKFSSFDFFCSKVLFFFVISQNIFQALISEHQLAPSILETFCQSASGHLTDLEKRLASTDSRFTATANRYGEKQIESHDFFKTFSEFFASLQEAKADNEKREQERRDQMRQEKLKIDRQERISRTASKVKTIIFLNNYLKNQQFVKISTRNWESRNSGPNRNFENKN